MFWNPTWVDLCSAAIQEEKVMVNSDPTIYVLRVQKVTVNSDPVIYVLRVQKVTVNGNPPIYVLRVQKVMVNIATQPYTCYGYRK